MRAWLLALLASACVTAPPELPRPAAWAEPVSCVGLPNLHRVSPHLWRGAQPHVEGFAELERLGVRTVVSLRSSGGTPLPAGSTLELVELPMHAWNPAEEDVLAFLRIATDPRRVPVFVHCYHGADRTGLMCAAYRRVVQGWSAEEALAEMRGGDFGFHVVWGDIVALVRELDVEHLRRELGLTQSP